MRSIRILLCLLGLALAMGAQAVSTSQVSGTIQDSSGGAIAGAQVKLIQTDTDAVRTTQTGADGSYLLANLPIGPYRLEVSKERLRFLHSTGH